MSARMPEPYAKPYSRPVYRVEDSMKRLLAFLLMLGLVVSAGLSRADDEKDKKKETKDKKDDKDKSKDKDKAKDKEKGKDKPEVKLTDAQKKELTKFEGTWTVTNMERDGKKVPAGDLAKMKVVQKGDTWTLTTSEETVKGKDVVYPDKTPKEIDTTYLDGLAKDKVTLGIYKIDGDTITFCFGEPGSKDRPKEFKAPADSGNTLWVLKKGKAEEPKDKDKKDGKDKKDEKKDDKKDKKDDKKDKKEEKKDDKKDK